MGTEVITYHLEMKSRDELRPASAPRDDLEVRRVGIPSPHFSRYLYTAVGAAWHWTDRLSWDYARWMHYLEKPGQETWVLYVAGTPAGYSELLACADGSVNVVYFGLVEGFIGQGLGGYLLTCVLARAWEMGASRVWLNTCSLDHAHALANYQARGLRVVRHNSVVLQLRDIPLEIWSQTGAG